MYLLGFRRISVDRRLVWVSSDIIIHQFASFLRPISASTLPVFLTLTALGPMPILILPTVVSLPTLGPYGITETKRVPSACALFHTRILIIRALKQIRRDKSNLKHLVNFSFNHKPAEVVHGQIIYV